MESTTTRTTDPLDLKQQGITPADQAPAADLALEAALARVRVAVGAALGVAEDAPLTPAEVATAVERLVAAARELPGLALLARDLS